MDKIDEDIKHNVGHFLLYEVKGLENLNVKIAREAAWRSAA